VKQKSSRERKGGGCKAKSSCGGKGRGGKAKIIMRGKRKSGVKQKSSRNRKPQRKGEKEKKRWDWGHTGYGQLPLPLQERRVRIDEFLRLFDFFFDFSASQ
jgi:hypothetical protein